VPPRAINRYVILEDTGIGLTVPERARDTLRMPEIGIEIPVGDLYQNVDLPEAGDSTPATS
jgi:hypothetical protein